MLPQKNPLPGGKPFDGPSAKTTDTSAHSSAKALAGFWGPISIGAPIALAGLGLTLALRGKSRVSSLALLSASASLGLLRWQLARFFSEEASYQSEGTRAGLEFRTYPSAIRAETFIQGSAWHSALKEGFHRLAGYIFGENASGSRITMTAPVLATTGRAFHHADRTISFVMPADRGLVTLPAPDDRRVRLREVPAHRVAVLSFRGRFDGDLPVIKRRELLSLVDQAGIVALGEVAFAGYDPPSTLPFLRRNEVMVQVGTPN